MKTCDLPISHMHFLSSFTICLPLLLSLPFPLLSFPTSRSLSLSVSSLSPVPLPPLSLLQVNGQDVGSMKVPEVEEMVQQCSHITLTLQGKLAQNGTRGKDLHHSHNRHTQIWITVHKLLNGYGGLVGSPAFTVYGSKRHCE